MKTAMQEWFDEILSKQEIWFDEDGNILQEPIIQYVNSFKSSVDLSEYVNKALEKEKKQIKEAFDFGDYCVELPLKEREGDYTWGKKYKSAEEYYNQTYNQNK